MTERCQFLVECLDLPGASGIPTAKWEHFQLEHFNCNDRFRIEVKSRQIAWSFTAAAEAIAYAILYNQNSLFISINLAESTEKIRYAHSIYEHLQGVSVPRIKYLNQLGMEFESGARVLSLFSPRGKPGFHVYLDEFAHFQHDRKQYTEAIPVITKGGRLRIGSSPMGSQGMFWEIFQQPIKQYPTYIRKVTPWWEALAFCNDVRGAQDKAPLMPTADRVEEFGTEVIRSIYDSMPSDDFQQEYECAYVDEGTSWITWEEIRDNTVQDLSCVLQTVKGEDMDSVRRAVASLRALIQKGMVEGVLAAGVDIGRTRNATEIMIGGEIEAVQSSYPIRLNLSIYKMPFPEQEETLKMIMDELPIHTMLIDRNGIGMQLGEVMDRYTMGKARGVDFTNQSKRLWATDAKMLIQKHQTPLPNDRDIKYQIHSIKRKVSSSNNMIFDSDRNTEHHADKFWAWVLMLNAVRVPYSLPETAIRSFS